MNLRELLGLKKTYSVKNLYIFRIRYIEDEISKRKIFRGPFFKDGFEYYEMLPSFEPFFTHNFSLCMKGFISFSDLFPDLKRVTLEQINDITRKLNEGDILEESKRLSLKRN